MKPSFVVVLLKEVGKVLCDLFEGYGLRLLDLLVFIKLFGRRKDCRSGCSRSLITVSAAAAITSRRGVNLRGTYSCSH
ncbi:hypothetical protein J2Z31_005464 [Sinorhizobium kostiense]|uniref:Secreted protein n=1 Tax=Sinorhizobium kostiense TaxID=76747 RepID=A0ABS4R7Q6_9HYPH|nr:hypothetical protein [Sinorhizobium kostiense]